MRPSKLILYPDELFSSARLTLVVQRGVPDLGCHDPQNGCSHEEWLDVKPTHPYTTAIATTYLE